jgi:hypothetical protein
MTRTRRLPIVITCCALVVVPAWARAQTKDTAPAAARPAVTGLMADIVISRYQGEKRLSSLPYTVTVNTDNSVTRLRVGGQIPVATPTIAPASDEKTAVRSYSYRDIGTNIDCQAVPADDGRYRLVVTIEETSVYGDESVTMPGRMTGAPAFRSFRTTNSLSLRHGQSVEFTSATDRVTGEVIKVSVKLTVIS